MRRPLALVLALLTAVPASAQVRPVVELALPSAPAAASAGSFTPIFAPPALGPSFAAPSLALSQPALAPAPVAARTALIQTGAALSAASKENADPAAVSRRTFDAAAKAPADASAGAPAVAAAPSVTAARPLSPFGPHVQVASVRHGGIKDAAIETAAVATTMIPFAFISMFMKGMMSNPAVMIPSILAVWTFAAYAMRDRLGGQRAVVVDSWQASHDQKYRTDYGTGRLKDIRGHKYGSDRYDAWKNGPVGPRETAAIATAAILAAAAFLLL